MKTSKVKAVVSFKEWNGRNGTVIYQNLEMENGDKINIGKKAKVSVGQELTYELTGEDDGQQEFLKAKSVMPQQNSFSGKKGGGDSLQILYSVCLKASTDLYNNHSHALPDAKEVASYAEELTRYSLKSLEELK